MELLPRTAGDALLRSGDLLRVRQRLRKTALRHDLRSVITCALAARGLQAE